MRRKAKLLLLKMDARVVLIELYMNKPVISEAAGVSSSRNLEDLPVFPL